MANTTPTLSRPTDRLRFTGKLMLGGNPALPCALVAVGAFLVMAGTEGGFDATTWYPAAVLFLALTVIAVVAFGDAPAPPRALIVGVTAMALFALWSFLSITWAENEARALQGASHAAMYALVLALFCVWPFDARGGRLVLACFGLGVAGLGLIVLLRANGSSDPLGFFIDARYAEPVGYINANVALWMLGLFACLSTAAAREAAIALRALALGGTGLLLALALMGQSRGWVFAAPLALAVYLVLAPKRVRVLVPALLAMAGVALIARPILDVHDKATDRTFDAYLGDATTAILALTGVLVAAGLAIAFADRRFSPAERSLQRLRVGTAVLTAALAIGAVVAFTAVEGSPVTKVTNLWQDFKGGGDQAQIGTSRFTTVGTNRYDFWTVAWDSFSAHPLKGIGSENFQETYLRQGKSGEQPRYPHSLPLGVLSQTGIVGAILLAVALGGLLVTAARALRSGRTPVAAVAAASVATFAYWFLHASVDWFWEFPGLTAPAFALLGLAAALAPRTGEPQRIAPGRIKGYALAAGATALAIVLIAPWRAEVEIARAADGWRTGIQAAYERLDRARALNPLTPYADSTAGSIALQVDDLQEAERRFRAVLRREPRNSFALLQLGLIEYELGRRRPAQTLIARAKVERPRDEIVAAALKAVRSGKRLSLASVNRRIAVRARSRRR